MIVRDVIPLENQEAVPIESVAVETGIKIGHRNLIHLEDSEVIFQDESVINALAVTLQ